MIQHKMSQSVRMVAVLSVVVLAFPVSAAPAPGKGKQDEALPIIKVAPIYPHQAVKERIEGHVLLEFVVAETGGVRDAVVLESEPRGVFDQAALDAVAKFKYKPKIVDGKPVAKSGVRNRFSFEFEDESSTDSTSQTVVPDETLPIVKVAPIYPDDALREGIEGHVLLEFVVTESGAVRDPRVLEAEPPGVFDQAALDAVGKFKYRPKVVD
ncbi:MAG: energy transducer TonB, partial [Gammaproteobacteria bacterium]|nr:energy transducer TonB [Gammaproteobacteria bacterium]